MPGGTANMLTYADHARAYRCHRQKLEEAKTMTDTTAPKPRTHLQLRLKQYQKQEERNALIDRDNKMLMNKMQAIMMSDKNFTKHPKKDYQGKSLNADYRSRQREQILMENVTIARRIQRTRPVYNVEEWKKDYKRQQHLVESWKKQNAKNRIYPLPLSHREYKENKKKRDKVGGSEGSLYESDFESDVETASEDKSGKSKLPPINSRTESSPGKGSDSKKSAAAADSLQWSPSPQQSRRGHRKYDDDTPDPDLWMYYNTKPNQSDDEDDDSRMSPKHSKKRDNVGSPVTLTIDDNYSSDFESENASPYHRIIP